MDLAQLAERPLCKRKARISIILVYKFDSFFCVCFCLFVFLQFGIHCIEIEQRGQGIRLSFVSRLGSNEKRCLFLLSWILVDTSRLPPLAI